MSRNAKDLDGCLQHSVLNGGPPNDNMQRLSRMKGKAPHVAIIGAGVAGLRCADVLIQSGVKVTVYEARDRVGGRVHQVKSAGHLVDLGPNWVHGNVKINPISKLAEKTKTLLHKWEDRQAVIDSTGCRIDDAEAMAYSEIIWEIVAKAFKYSDDCSSSIDPRKSLMDYFKEEVPKRESNPAKIAEILKMAQRWGAFVGDPIERQSLKFFFLEETIDGEHAFVAGTYQKILAEIAANVLAHASIHLSTEIHRIGSRESLLYGGANTESADIKQQRSSVEPYQHGISIYTSTGVEQQFDEVVVTAPLGWLKAHKKTAFTTPLPQRLSQAMDNISYGRLEKVYVTFPTAFWHGKSSKRIEIQTELSNMTNNMATQRSQPKKGPDATSIAQAYPSFTHFQSPSYVIYPPNLSWNQECISLADVPSSTAHPTLLFYVFGPCATAMVQSITDIPPNSGPYNAKLDAFFQPFYSKLPNYSLTDESCKPVAFLATQWQNDPFAGHGSYTNYQVGLEEGDKDIEIMRHGCPERGLWFAGEHTAPFIALGTTTGAYWAGEGVARRICGEYGIPVPVEDEEVGMKEVRVKDVESVRRDAANLNGMAL